MNLENCTLADTLMNQTLAPELEQQAQELATRLQSRLAELLLEMARRLVLTSPETLFGDTEFALRDTALGLVAATYAEHLDKKKATSAPLSTAPTAELPPVSTTTAAKRSKRLVVRSPVSAPITTAAPVAPAPPLGISKSV